MKYVSRVAERLKAKASHSIDASIRGEVEDQVAADMRKEFGNRLRAATSGGASVSGKVLEFMRKRLQVDVVDAYGSRETGGIANNGKVNPNVDVKIVDIPEMGYFSAGDPSRGEILVHSPNMIHGYFNEPELNAKCFTTIGGKIYYRTGDIGEYPILQYLGSVVLERSGAVLKLAQGEWIVPTKVETLLEESPYVAQALVLGDPLSTFLVAIIVPTSLGNAMTDVQFLNEIRIWCTHHHLRPAEIPQAIFIERNSWTSENGFLTSTEKKRRLILNKHYSDIAAELYKNTKHVKEEQTSILVAKYL